MRTNTLHYPVGTSLFFLLCPVIEPNIEQYMHVPTVFVACRVSSKLPGTYEYQVQHRKYYIRRRAAASFVFYCCSFLSFLRPTNLSFQKTENKRGFPLCGVETHPRLSVFSRSVPQQRKKRAFRTQHWTAATSPRLTGRGS